PHRAALFPYTTLFRSRCGRAARRGGDSSGIARRAPEGLGGGGPPGPRVERSAHPVDARAHRRPAGTAHPRVRPAPCADDRGLAVRAGGPLVTAAAALLAEVWGILETVEDPELPIAI